jgi:NACHT N-terminal Helical domain 1/NACHT domain
VVDPTILVGKEVAKFIAGRWLAVRRDKMSRDAELIDLITLSVRDKIYARKLARRLEEIVDHAAERLQSFYDAELPRGMESNEREAALLAVADCLAASTITDDVLFEVNLDPNQLARRIRDDVSATRYSHDLKLDAKDLFNRVLDDCCMQIVQIVRQLPAFDGRALTELLQRMAVVTEDLGDILLRLPRAPLGSDLLATESDFRRNYLQYVSDHLDQLHLFGIITRNYKPRTLVTTAYMSLNVTFIDFGRALRRTVIDQFGMQDLEGRAIEAETALSLSNKVLLRGHAGSGKTTLLQWIAVNAARSSFTGVLTKWNGKVPFFVKLRSYAGKRLPDLQQLVTDFAPTLSVGMLSGWAPQVFSNGEAILLVDGVDELSSPEREKVEAWLRAILIEHSPTIIVTTRPSAVEETWLGAYGFTTATLEAMNPSDVEAFCHRWHMAVAEAAVRGHATLSCDPTELAGYENTLRHQLLTRRHLRSIATTPLLCAMLCALNLDRRKTLPPDRIKIYEDAIELLVDRRDSERAVLPSDRELNLTSATKSVVLQHIAWKFMTAGRSEMTVEDVEEIVSYSSRYITPIQQLDARDVTKFLLLRSGIIREPSIGRVDFIHRSFQEYLAAKYAANEHEVDFLLDQAERDQWRETIIMTAGLASRPHQERLVGTLIERARRRGRGHRKLLLLAAACLETANRLPPELIHEVEDSLNPLFPPTKASEARSLALGSPRSLACLPTTVQHLPSGTAAACVQAAAYMNQDGSIELLSKYAKDTRPRVQQDLIKMWRLFDTSEYAQKVLAEAPLVDGVIVLDRPSYGQHLHYLKNLKSVRFDISDQIEGIEFLRDVKHLNGLSITTRNPIDLSELSEHEELRLMSITGAGVDGAHSLQRISSNLEHLALSLPGGQYVIPHLMRFQALRSLLLGDLGEVENLDGLATLPELKKLSLLRCHQLKSLGSLTNHRQLREITLISPRLRGGLSALEALIFRLSSLTIQDCRQIRDLSDLAISSLNNLAIWDCDVDDLLPLAEIKSLTSASLVNLRIRDLSPLALLPKLNRLDVSGSAATVDITAFKNHETRLEIVVTKNQIIVGEDKVGPNIRVLRR